jgi:hypothetical protein
MSVGMPRTFAPLAIASALVLAAGCNIQPADLTPVSSDGGAIEPVAPTPGAESDAGATADAGGDADGPPSADAAAPTPAIPPGPGPLAGLPSAAGPNVATIAALGDNAWVKLPAPQGDPMFGRARGRSWGGRAFVLAPELRGAFYYGEGVHAFVKPDGHTMDDLWFYDMNAHRWIAVYPGTHAATFTQKVKDDQLKIDANNQLADANGYPVPVHTLIHAWDFLTYDPITQKFAFLAGDGLGRYFLGNESLMDEGLKLLDAQRAGKASPPMSPWFYDTVAGHFERYPVANAAPTVGSFGNFQFVKSRGQYFHGGSSGVAYFDPVTKTWTSVNDQGPRPPGYDHGGVYDEERDRIYMGAGASDPTGTFYVYDLKTERWSKPAASGSPPSGIGTNNASIFYDVKNDVVTIFQYAEKKIYTYVPTTGTWSNQVFPATVLSSVGGPSFNAFYDPTLNAYFCYVAGDSEDNGVMWAYRYHN